MSSPKGHTIRGLLTAIILANLLQSAYQQKQQLLSTELSLCAADSTESTIRTFWNEASGGNCPMDPYKLMDLYEDVTSRAGISASASSQGSQSKQGSAKCNQLLSHNLRRSLIESSAIIFEEALITQTFSKSAEVQRLSKRLAQLDWRISDAVWARTIEGVYFFINVLELHEALYELKNLEARVLALMQLYSKPVAWNEVDNAKLAVRKAFVYHNLQSVLHELPEELMFRLRKVYDSWPAQLHHLFNSIMLDGLPVGLLNAAHWEYLYVPRDNGPNANQRVPLTWIQDKNTTDSDGELYLTYNSNGDVSFGSRFNAALKYLYVDEDERKPYVWVGQGTMPNRWWQMEWYEESAATGDYYLFRNAQSTQELLCATVEYDENRRYVTVNSQLKNKFSKTTQCRWRFNWSSAVLQS